MVFWSVQMMAKSKGVSSQAILDDINFGRYDAIKIGHCWRIIVYDRYLQPYIMQTRKKRGKKC